MEKPSLRKSIFVVIFGTETKYGKRFDIWLLWVILASILIVCLETVPSIQKAYGKYFVIVDWVFTGIFTLEYILRVYSHPRPKKYIFSFYGIIDLLAFIPSYFSLIGIASKYIMTIRVFRLIRIFRIFNLSEYILSGHIISEALKASLQKITVFIISVLSLVLVIGTLMYVVEGAENGFTSIPQSIYWAIVTITTVGYGDITPQTTLGQMISSFVMLIGYAIIAVPTGIVTVELANSQKNKKVDKALCTNCGHSINNRDNYCSNCGTKLMIKA